MIQNTSLFGNTSSDYQVIPTPVIAVPKPKYFGDYRHSRFQLLDGSHEVCQ